MGSKPVNFLLYYAKSKSWSILFIWTSLENPKFSFKHCNPSYITSYRRIPIIFTGKLFGEHEYFFKLMTRWFLSIRIRFFNYLPTWIRNLDIPFQLSYVTGLSQYQDNRALVLRGFAYQAISHLGERCPSVLRQDLELPEHLFHALSTEEAGVRASLQQSLSTLSIAYKGLEGKSCFSKFFETLIISQMISRRYPVLCF